MIMWLYATLLGFRYCGRGGKTFLICHVISKDHVLKSFSDFIGGSPL